MNNFIRHYINMKILLALCILLSNSLHAREIPVDEYTTSVKLTIQLNQYDIVYKSSECSPEDMSDLETVVKFSKDKYYSLDIKSVRDNELRFYAKKENELNISNNMCLWMQNHPTIHQIFNIRELIHSHVSTSARKGLYAVTISIRHDYKQHDGQDAVWEQKKTIVVPLE